MSNTSGCNQNTSACSGCRTQRKKCSDKCVLPPYFPQSEPQKFMLVHTVFGNGRVVKLLQGLPAELRGDAVSSMVYEAEERIRDPVHGCVGVINDLQRKVAELQLQLESTQVELANISVEHGNLLTLLTGYDPHGSYPNLYTTGIQEVEDTIMNPNVLDNDDPLPLWSESYT
eukprot:PITA_07854